MTIRLRRGLLLLAIISVVGALMLSVGVTFPKEAQASFCGQPGNPPCCDQPPVTICIQDATSAGASPANPYPSEINVQGLSGTITDVNVTLNGFRHGFPDDVAVQVVSPGPTGKSVLLMSDVGGPLPSGSAPVSNINLTLDDEAANSLSDSTAANHRHLQAHQGNHTNRASLWLGGQPGTEYWLANACARSDRER